MLCAALLCLHTACRTGMPRCSMCARSSQAAWTAAGCACGAPPLQEGTCWQWHATRQASPPLCHRCAAGSSNSSRRWWCGAGVSVACCCMLHQAAPLQGGAENIHLPVLCVLFSAPACIQRYVHLRSWDRLAEQLSCKALALHSLQLEPCHALRLFACSPAYHCVTTQCQPAPSCSLCMPSNPLTPQRAPSTRLLNLNCWC